MSGVGRSRSAGGGVTSLHGVRCFWRSASGRLAAASVLVCCVYKAGGGLEVGCEVFEPFATGMGQVAVTTAYRLSQCTRPPTLCISRAVPLRSKGRLARAGSRVSQNLAGDLG